MEAEVVDEEYFIDELSSVYRLAQYIVQIPTSKIRNFETIIDRALQMNPNSENALICYTTFNYHDYTRIANLLKECQRKFPRCVYFYELYGDVNGFLQQYEEILISANRALKIDPNHLNCLRNRASALRLMKGGDLDDAIQTFEKFLSLAPKDHRDVPDVYYEIAQCYMNKQ